MKKVIIYLFTVISAFLFINCSNGSSGTAMLNLDVRIIPSEDVKEKLEEKMNPDSWKKRHDNFEDFSNLFTVLPGPYEFVWEELKNVDGQAGNEMCHAKLKIRLRLNKTLKSETYYGYKMTEKYMMDRVVEAYRFAMFNPDGKTEFNLLDENDEHYRLFFNPQLLYVTGVDGKIASKKNTDGILDFYHFVTSKPGTEFDLILDCGCALCKDIEEMIEYNKGMYIMLMSAAVREQFCCE